MINYLKNWNFTRAIRLALGIFIIVQGVQTSQWLFVFLGGLFSLMPLMNVGCGSTAGCSTPFTKTKKSTEDVTYEEVV